MAAFKGEAVVKIGMGVVWAAICGLKLVVI